MFFVFRNKCLRLASEKFVLANEKNLSLATGLASWKVSLKPCIMSVNYAKFQKRLMAEQF